MSAVEPFYDLSIMLSKDTNEAPEPEATPILTIDHNQTEPAIPHLSKISVDLGYLALNATKRFQVTLINPSDFGITIRHIKPMCACTKVLEAPEYLEPRTRSTIIFEIEAFAHPTFYSKNVMTYLDHPDIKEINLTVDGRMGMPLIAIPNKLNLSKLAEQTYADRKIYVRNDSTESIRLLYPTYNIDGLTARIPLSPWRQEQQRKSP